MVLRGQVKLGRMWRPVRESVSWRVVVGVAGRYTSMVWVLGWTIQTRGAPWLSRKCARSQREQWVHA